jgi:hypothetical protein
MAKISRRDAMQMLSGGIGVSFGVPGLAADHPMHEHLADQVKVATAEKRAAAVQYKPAFLNAHELATTTSLAERIVPGASRAKSAEFIDQLLAVDTQSNQRGFLNALGSFEGKAIEKSKGPWTKLTPAQQDEILIEASTAEPGTRLREHFDVMKGWVAGAYYSSEIGMRELGWTGKVMFAEFPGCPHPEGHP